MKAYENKNTHEAWCENEHNTLGNIIERMYDYLEAIDPYPEYDEQTLATNINSLREEGNDELADELATAAEAIYG